MKKNFAEDNEQNEDIDVSSEKENSTGTESEFAYKKVMVSKQNSRLLSLISIAFSALSVFLCFIPWLGIISGCLGVLFAVLSRKNIGYFDNISLVALIIGIFGTVFAVMGIIFAHILPDFNIFSLFKKDSIISFKSAVSTFNIIP